MLTEVEEINLTVLLILIYLICAGDVCYKKHSSIDFSHKYEVKL